MFIRVNTGLEGLSGNPDFGYQVGVAVPLNKPNEYGFPSNEEMNELNPIEDSLVDSFCAQKKCVFAAVITTGGMREFAFYTGEPKFVEAQFAAVKKKISGHELQLNIRKDEKWDVYKSLHATN